MIKLVSKSDLENDQHNRSIGYHFLQALKKEDQVKDSNLFDGKDEVLWKNAKDIVKDGLSEKRNARQTQMENAWKGSYLFITKTENKYHLTNFFFTELHEKQHCWLDRGRTAPFHHNC